MPPGIKRRAGHPALKARYAEDPAVAAAIGVQTVRLGDRGRVVVRASGTEPLIRVMVEGEELWEIEEAAAAIVAAIEGCR